MVARGPGGPVFPRSILKLGGRTDHTTTKKGNRKSHNFRGSPGERPQSKAHSLYRDWPLCSAWPFELTSVNQLVGWGWDDCSWPWRAGFPKVDPKAGRSDGPHNNNKKENRKSHNFRFSVPKVFLEIAISRLRLGIVCASGGISF
jgi:hypothetical protein